MGDDIGSADKIGDGVISEVDFFGDFGEKIRRIIIIITKMIPVAVIILFLIVFSANQLILLPKGRRRG